MGIMAKIEEVVRKLEHAKRVNDALQEKTAVGSPAWHSHETIDDKLHEALAALGH